MNIMIVGVGGIGKRHLQSILKLKFNKIIYLVDLYINSEDIHNHFNYNKNFNRIICLKYIPNKTKINFAVVSTNIDSRFKITKKIINNTLCKNILLEKIVFDSRKHYLEINRLSKKNKVNIFINYTRSFTNSYLFLQKNINYMDIEYMNVYGSKWNLGSNSSHFINLFSLLTNSNITKLIYEKIHNRLYNSKRKMFNEIKGKIILTNNNNQKLVIEDNIKFKAFLIIIKTSKYIFEINESTYKLTKTNIKKNKSIIYNFKNEYVSSLTQKLIINVINKNFNHIPCLNKNIKNELFYLNFIEHLKFKYKKLSNLKLS